MGQEYLYLHTIPHINGIFLKSNIMYNINNITGWTDNFMYTFVTKTSDSLLSDRSIDESIDRWETTGGVEVHGYDRRHYADYITSAS